MQRGLSGRAKNRTANMNWYYHANMNWYYDCFDLPNSNLVSWVPSNQGGLPAAKKNIYKNYTKKYIYIETGGPGRRWTLLAMYCSDSFGCNTRIKVKHQITKLLTKVLTHADALRWDRMHYGETECLKQRCVHQQVSDSSGWLMLMHFIFKFNAQTVLVAIQESKLNIK